MPKLGVQKLDPSALMPYYHLIPEIRHPEISEIFHCLDEDIPDKNAILIIDLLRESSSDSKFKVEDCRNQVKP